MTCFDITHNVIAPLFKNGDYAGGLKAGVDRDDARRCAANTRGPAKPPGRAKAAPAAAFPIGLIILLLIVIFLIMSSRPAQGDGAVTVTPVGAARSSADLAEAAAVGQAAAARAGAAVSVVLAVAAAVLAAAAPDRAGRCLCAQKNFSRKLDHDRIVRAIATAEAKTSGEIRVFIQRGNVADAVSDARAQFEQLGMTQTRNATPF